MYFLVDNFKFRLVIRARHFFYGNLIRCLIFVAILSQYWALVMQLDGRAFGLISTLVLANLDFLNIIIVIG